MASQVCELPDGRRIRYFLKKRNGRPCYFACFVGRDNKRHESSTSEGNLKRAQESANSIIREAYATKIAFIAWDDAMTLATRHMKANNLRGTTIQQYELAVKTLRKVFPKSTGPSDITPAMAEQFKVARLEQGRKKYQREQIELNAALAQLLDAHGPRIAEAGLELKRELPVENVSVVTDRDAVEQIVLNLLDNACKYAASGGEAVVALRPRLGGFLAGKFGLILGIMPRLKMALRFSRQS